MKKAIVLDIDGVLLKSDIIFEEIFNLKLRGDVKWDYFHQYCNSERVLFIKNIIPFLHGAYIILSTARNEKCRKETTERLLKEGLTFEKLLMRKENDYRPSNEVKRDHLKEIMQNYEIVAFIDDDLANCEMAKDLGILALRKV